MNSVNLMNPRYRLHEQLGAGGMGAVYRAYDRLTQTFVALKQVSIPTEMLEFMSRASLGDSLGLWKALAEEFKILASLRHPNIISVLDYGFDAERQPYYTMDLLHKPQNLLDYGSDQLLNDKINLIIQLLQALDYLHRRSIIHRDLKPDNALVVNGQVKVLDFGLAVTRKQDGADDSPAGTLHYMSPEVLNGGEVTLSADLYAVGVMAYQLLTGEYPFNCNQSLDDLIREIVEQPVDLSALPIAPDIARVIGNLLSKTASERYSSAAECINALCVASGLPLPPETAAIRDSFVQAAEFVGRQAEIRQLSDALAQALDKHGSAWLVGGESGVGKSRLLDELRTQSLVEGALVLRGQAVEGGGLPYQVWRDPLRRMVLSVEMSDFEAGVLKPIVSDIAALLERDIPDVPELTGEAGKTRLNTTVMELFQRHPQPVVVLLEDLQWAEESLQLLKQLSAHCTTLPLLLIGNFRNDERPDLPKQLPDAQLLILPRLNEAEIAELSAGMLGENGRDPQIVERLSQETEGNTFFMVEIVRALAEMAGRLGDVGQMTLPHSIMAGGIQKIVRRRLERIPSWGKSLLKLAAVAGRQLDLAVLEVLIAQATDLDGRTSDEWLRACADVAVLEIVDERWRFAHDKLREQLVTTLDEAERRDLHRVIALALEAAHPNDPMYDEMLLTHWREAGDSERELHYTLPVAQKMIQFRAAYVQADALITRGLLLTGENDIRRPTLLNFLSEASSRRADYASASEYAQAALTLAEKLNVPNDRGRGLVNLGHIALERGDYTAAETYFEQSHALYRDTGHKQGVASSLNGLGIISCMRGNDAAAKDYFQQSLTVCRESNYGPGIAANLNELGLIAHYNRESEVAEAYHQQSLALRRESGDLEGITVSLSNLGLVFNQRGEYALAEAYWQESLSLSRNIGVMIRVVLNLDTLAMLAFDQNQPSMTAYLHEGLATSLEIGTESFTLEICVTIGRHALRTGEVAEAARLAGLIETHPALSGETRKEYLSKLLDELRVVFSAEELTDLMAEGAQLDLEVTARAWLLRLEG